MTRPERTCRPLPSRSERRSRLSAAFLIGVLAISGCDSTTGRSVGAFCTTLHSEKQRILNQLNRNVGAAKATGDGLLQALGGLGASIQAIGELRIYFRKLATVAPEPIRTEVELIRDDYDEQFKHLSDMAAHPLAALAAGLVGGMASSGQMNTVNSFAVSNCREGI